jgi:hypothetical protein
MRIFLTSDEKGKVCIILKFFNTWSTNTKFEARVDFPFVFRIEQRDFDDTDLILFHIVSRCFLIGKFHNGSLDLSVWKCDAVLIQMARNHERTYRIILCIYEIECWSLSPETSEVLSRQTCRNGCIVIPYRLRSTLRQKWDCLGIFLELQFVDQWTKIWQVLTFFEFWSWELVMLAQSKGQRKQVHIVSFNPLIHIGLSNVFGS